MVEVFKAANSSHPRYILVNDDAPLIVNTFGLVEAYEDDSITEILLLTGDGQTAAVEVEHTHEGGRDEYFIYEVDLTLGGRLLEEIQFDESGENVVKHDVFVNGFDTDRVPVFTASVT